MESQLDPEYINKAISAIPWEKIGMSGSIQITEYRIMIALLAQMNLQLSRLSNLLMMATGIVDTEEDVADISENAPDRAEAINKAVEAAMKKSVVCGSCGKGVMPTAMGYCPSCKQDLKKQVAQELLNKVS